MSDRSMAWAVPCPIVFPLMRRIYSQFMRRGRSLLSACDCAVCATEQEFRLMPVPTAQFSSLYDGSETGNCSCKSMRMRDLGLMSRLLVYHKIVFWNESLMLVEVVRWSTRSSLWDKLLQFYCSLLCKAVRMDLLQCYHSNFGFEMCWCSVCLRLDLVGHLTNSSSIKLSYSVHLNDRPTKRKGTCSQRRRSLLFTEKKKLAKLLQSDFAFTQSKIWSHQS
jgi:hypothetical protein